MILDSLHSPVFGHDPASQSITTSRELYNHLLGGRISESGQVVSLETAVTVTAVRSAVQIIAESIAAIPFHLYKRTIGPANRGGRERLAVGDHPVASLIQFPSPNQNSFDWREYGLSSILLHGNWTCLKVRSGNPKTITRLEPLEPGEQITHVIKGGQRVFQFTPSDGPIRDLPPSDVFHVRGYHSRFDKFWGASPIDELSESIGTFLSARQYGARLFRNGGFHRGYFETDEFFNDTQLENFLEHVGSKWTGPSHAGSRPLLEGGVKFNPTDMTPADSQVVDLLKFLVAEVSRVYRVPLHLLNENVAQPRANMFESNLRFVQYTLLPLARRIELAAGHQLLDDNPDIFAWHTLEGFLRADFKTRMEGYAIALEQGFMNRNEVRELENRNPLPDEELGERYSEGPHTAGGRPSESTSSGAAAGIPPPIGRSRQDNTIRGTLFTNGAPPP